MPKHPLSFEFIGVTQTEFYSPSDSRLSVLSGTNNCGKTLLLKLLFEKLGQLAYLCGTNRYFDAQYFGRTSTDPDHVARSWKQAQDAIENDRHNYDPLALDFMSVFMGLKDDERTQVYNLAAECLGESVGLSHIEPLNSMSHAFIRVGETPLSKCSSGSRLLIHLLSVLLSSRYKFVLLDEPELGLTPRIQNTLQQLLLRAEEHFPHLRHVYVASHSHIFLNPQRLGDNFLVSRNGTAVKIQRLESQEQFRDLQFSQLGNSFTHLQLPSGFLIVEGKTDHAYLKRLLLLRKGGGRVNVICANGDNEVKRKAHELREIVGDFSSSPYAGRVLVLLDATHSPTLPGELQKMGLPGAAVLTLSHNGIEHYYPLSILRELCSNSSLAMGDLTIADDRVTVSGKSWSKAQLSNLILDRLSGSEQLAADLQAILARIDAFA